MPSSAAAIWSAIAASFSAITAVTVMRIQHKNMLDASKPEIVLDGWKRSIKGEGDFKRDVLSFNKILNTGKGSALHVYINANEDEIIKGGVPTVAMSTARVSIIPAGKDTNVNSEITLWWQNAKKFGSDNKYISVEIKILCWCSSGYRHETIYNLMVFDMNNPSMTLGNSEVVPGVSLTTRRTISRPVWILKLYRSLSKLPLVGKYVPYKK